MSASWVTAAVESGSSEVAIRIGDRQALTTRPDESRESLLGPTPLELLLASLGACTAVALKQFAATRDWPLEVVEVDLEIGNRQSSTSITRLVSLQGSLDRDQREKLLAVAEQSPVTLLLARGLRIRTELA